MKESRRLVEGTAILNDLNIFSYLPALGGPAGLAKALAVGSDCIWCLTLEKLLKLNSFIQRTVLQLLVNLKAQKQRAMKLPCPSPKSNLNLVKLPRPKTNLQQAEEGPVHKPQKDRAAKPQPWETLQDEWPRVFNKQPMWNAMNLTCFSILI